MNHVMIRRALLSVSDKSLLEELAHVLTTLGVEILASGGTADRLRKAGIKYRPVEEYTGNPEAFDGRMKTISFQLESAILFDRRSPAHVEQAKQLKIEPIDLVVCNFYPFEMAASKGAGEEDLVHNIDVGGPTMVRSAAKNFYSVGVLTDPSDYQAVMSELRTLSGALTLETRRRLAVKAFERTMSYDRAIFEAFNRRPLRYGENPHQVGFFVPDCAAESPEGHPMTWELVEPAGLELSYNNILDGQAALGAMRDARLAAEAGHGAVAIVKHNNPCGLATGATIVEAFTRAWAGDPVSAFGGVIALSSPLTVECARLLDEKFVEVLMAPGFEDGAVEELRRKKKKLRVLKINALEAPPASQSHYQRMRVDGGTLVQQPDEGLREEFRVVTKTKFPDELLPAARFGVAAAKWIKSNAISIVRRMPDGGLQLVGMGSGQPNRVDAIRKLALPKARDVLKAVGAEGGDVTRALAQCVLVSDAFFPFSDNVEETVAGGIRLIVQPGGSIRDNDVIAAADKLGVAMIFTGRRHFRH